MIRFSHGKDNMKNWLFKRHFGFVYGYFRTIKLLARCERRFLNDNKGQRIFRTRIKMQHDKLGQQP